MSLPDVLPVAAALAGALVGGIVAELRTALQGLRERRRALRVLLYELLELRFRLTTLDPRAILPALENYMVRRFGVAVAEVFKTPEWKVAMSVAFQAAAASIPKSSLGDEYESAVNAIAPHDPVLAYRLRDQHHVLEFDRGLKQYYDGVLALLQLDPDASAIREKAEPATLTVTLQLALNDLGDRIREIARSLSPFTWFSVTRILKRQNEQSSPELERLIDQILDSAGAPRPGPGGEKPK